MDNINMDDKSIIYLALSNLHLNCIQVLEDEEINLNEKDKEYTIFMLNKSEELMDKYAKDINQESTPIQRPSWGRKET